MEKLGCIMFKVSKLNQSVNFYRDILGLRVDFEMEDFVMFKTSGACFALQAVDNPGTISTDGISLTFEIENGVDELFRDVRKRGVSIRQSPRNMEWGGRLVLLDDPDGYEVGFYEMMGPLCEACGMPMKSDKMRGGGIEDNPYCVYCCNDNGELKCRVEIRESMIKYYLQSRGKSRDEAEQLVDEVMKWLPAWKDG